MRAVSFGAMSAVRRSWVPLVLGLVTVACGATGQPSASTERSAPSTSAASAGGVSGLPPGCEPIELRAPDGSPVDLDGVWVEQSRTGADQLTWWIRTQGDCLYGVGTVADVSEEGLATDHGQVIQYIGTIRRDFSIDGQMAHLSPPNFLEGEVPPVSETRFLIEFTDNGGVHLREDREPGVVTGGPRCLHQNFCFPPLVLAPRED
jgi:hypothetical protein